MNTWIKKTGMIAFVGSFAVTGVTYSTQAAETTIPMINKYHENQIEMVKVINKITLQITFEKPLSESELPVCGSETKSYF